MQFDQNNILKLLVVFVAMIVVSCDDQDPVAEALLYGNAGRPPVEIELAMTRVDVWYLANGTFLYGFDVRIHNPNLDTIRDVSVDISNVKPAGDVVEVSDDDDQFYIPYIAPSDFEYPDFYWCFDCHTVYEVYIGNFWVVLEPYVSGGQVFEVMFEVEFVLGEKTYDFRLERTFTTVYDPWKNSITSPVCSNISTFN